MKCLDVMSAPVRTIRGAEDTLVAACLMREHRVGYLPVCNDAGEIIGVVTERDLAIGVCAENQSPQEVLVRHVMSTPAITCRPHHTLADVQRQMLAHRHEVLTVIDDESRPVGVISLWDIFDARDGHVRRVRASP